MPTCMSRHCINPCHVSRIAILRTYNYKAIYGYVTLSHLRSKEITGIHKPCIPHSNDSSATTEYKPVCIQM